ncbi:MAG: hypothetical protein H7311_05620 [Ramlibacter sp.]|nr:hypothetical protein [Cryobacterium sp.]
MTASDDAVVLRNGFSSSCGAAGVAGLLVVIAVLLDPLMVFGAWDGPPYTTAGALSYVLGTFCAGQAALMFIVVPKIVVRASYLVLVNPLHRVMVPTVAVSEIDEAGNRLALRTTDGRRIVAWGTEKLAADELRILLPLHDRASDDLGRLRIRLRRITLGEVIHLMLWVAYVIAGLANGS